MTKKSQELSQKTEDDLKKLLAEKREALRACRFGATGSRTRDTKLGMTLRKEIARIMTQVGTLARTKNN